MDVKRVFWFSGGAGVIGIVVGEDSVTKERKAYIGTAAGEDEDADTKKIASTGAKFAPGEAHELYLLLNPTGVDHGP